MNIKNFGAATLLILIPGLVQADAEMPIFNFMPEEFSAGRADWVEGRPAAASAINVSPERAVDLVGFQFRGDSAMLTADHLHVSASGSLSLRGGRISALEEGHGTVSFREGTFSSEALLERLMLGDTCEAFVMGGNGSEDLGELALTGILVQAPADVLSRTAGEYDVGGPESFSIDKMALTVVGAPGADCFMPSTFVVDNATALAADGTAGAVGRVEGSIDLLPGAGAPYSINLSMHDLWSRDAEGVGLARIDKSQIIITMDGKIVEGVRKLPELADAQVLPEAMRLLAEGDFGLTYQQNGIYFPLGELMSDSQRARFGSDGTEVLTGDMTFSLTSTSDRIRLLVDTQVDGAAYQILDLGLVVDPKGSGSSAMAMTGGHPAGMVLPYLQLEDLRFSIEDKGVWGMAERKTGQAPEAMLSRLTPFAAMAPDEIAKPLIGWFSSVAQTGKGWVKMDPIEPIRMIDIGMAAMMNPAGLGQMLSIQAQ